MSIGLFVILPITLAGIVLLAYFLKMLLKNRNSTDIILLGMEITIIGGILLISKSINFVGSDIVEISAVFTGLSVSLAGLLKKNKV